MWTAIQHRVETKEAYDKPQLYKSYRAGFNIDFQLYVIMVNSLKNICVSSNSLLLLAFVKRGYLHVILLGIEHLYYFMT